MPDPGPGPVPRPTSPANPNSHTKKAPPPEPYNGDFDKQPPRKPEIPEQAPEQPLEKKQAGCVFAKSCNLPDGIIDYPDVVTPEYLNNYGDWAVMAPAAPPTTAHCAVPLAIIGSSTSASAIAARLGGQISVSVVGATLGAAIANTAGTVAATIGTTAIGAIALLIPSPLSKDSAFYTREQLAALTVGRTRVRLHVQELPTGAVTAYGFYTGGKPDWENTRKVEAKARGDQYVADLGNGIELTWTPAVNTGEILGTPALEGSEPLTNIWVYPPTEQANKALVNPVHPPDYQDAIIWFPVATIPAIYVSLSVMPGDHSYHPKPESMPAFPELTRVRGKTRKKGGGIRDRWKDNEGTIYEWDSQHGALEKYNKRGKHLGEFDPITGLQTKPADKTREVEP